MLIHPSPEHLHFWAALFEEPRHPIPYIQIRLRFNGPERLYLYYPTDPLSVDPEISRLHASIRAQWILHTTYGVSVAPPAPNDDSAYVNLNYLAIDTLPTMSQTEFGFLLQALVPDPETPMAYWVSEWTVTCPYCKTEVVGFSSDRAWNDCLNSHIDEDGCRERHVRRKEVEWCDHRAKL